MSNILSKGAKNLKLAA
jgi:hypothetical protein